MMREIAKDSAEVEEIFTDPFPHLLQVQQTLITNLMPNFHLAYVCHQNVGDMKPNKMLTFHLAIQRILCT